MDITWNSEYNRLTSFAYAMHERRDATYLRLMHSLNEELQEHLAIHYGFTIGQPNYEPVNLPPIHQLEIPVPQQQADPANNTGSLNAMPQPMALESLAIPSVEAMPPEQTPFLDRDPSASSVASPQREPTRDVTEPIAVASSSVESAFLDVYVERIFEVDQKRMGIRNELSALRDYCIGMNAHDAIKHNRIRRYRLPEMHARLRRLGARAFLNDMLSQV
jgi:hypothetical protein